MLSTILEGTWSFDKAQVYRRLSSVDGICPKQILWKIHNAVKHCPQSTAITTGSWWCKRRAWKKTQTKRWVKCGPPLHTLPPYFIHGGFAGRCTNWIPHYRSVDGDMVQPKRLNTGLLPESERVFSGIGPQSQKLDCQRDNMDKAAHHRKQAKLGWCWASVVDDGPILNQHWVNVSCLTEWEEIWEEENVLWCTKPRLGRRPRVCYTL